MYEAPARRLPRCLRAGVLKIFGKNEISYQEDFYALGVLWGVALGCDAGGYKALCVNFLMRTLVDRKINSKFACFLCSEVCVSLSHRARCEGKS